MGRKKIRIERIADERSRQACCARERLSSLCLCVCVC
jgi:hypothetical protein